MGLYDREYYREEESRGAFFRGQHSMVTNLIVINVVIFLADVLLAQSAISDALALEPRVIQQPWMLWKLLSYGFAHNSQDIFHVGFNMFFLWLFGREMENLYGRKEFLWLYVSIIVFGGLCWLAVGALLPSLASRALVGASGACVGVSVLYAIHYPKRIFYLWAIVPLPVWVLVGFMVLKDFVSFRASAVGDSEDKVAHEVHLAGAVFAAMYYKTHWHLGRLFGGFSLASVRRRPKLRIHDASRQDRDLSASVDKILEKISVSGEESLTKQERRILEDASRRYQRRQR